jgi:two-component system, sensor histidine kinase and response regulator
MPELDGYAAAREIRRREGGERHVPLVAVTAHAFEGERQKALAAGMDDYVTKPIDPRNLAEVIQRWWPKPAQREPEATARQDADSESGTGRLLPGGLDPNVPRSDAVVRLFLKHVPDQIEQIGRSIAASDAAGLKAAAHKLKGGCLAVGVPFMAELCRVLETGGADAPRLLSELEREYEQVRVELERQRARSAESIAS